MEELKTKIMSLWTKEMGNIQYLRNLVEFRPRRLQDMINKDGSCTSKFLNVSISFFIDFCDS